MATGVVSPLVPGRVSPPMGSIAQSSPGVLDDAVCYSSDDSIPSCLDSPSSPHSASFVFSPQQLHIIKRIPKGARIRAAQVFTSCLHQVLSSGPNLHNWHHLLSFASCLRSPPRGGKRHNLTRHILSQIELFDQGDVISYYNLSNMSLNCG